MVLCVLITAKMPEFLRNQWTLHCLDPTQNITEGNRIARFLEWMDKQCQAEEVTKELGLGTSTSFQPTEPARLIKKNGGQPKQPTISLNTQVKTCGVCGGNNHLIKDCQKDTSPEDLFKILKSKGICYCCFGKGHKVPECKKKWQCKKNGCQGYHNPRVCHDNIYKN